MNALTLADMPTLSPGQAESSLYRFYSSRGGIEAGGCFESIQTPAAGDGKALEQDLQSAFARAREAGLARPLAIGVIPFDKRQPSQLCIPRHLVRLLPSAPPTEVCGMPCGAVRQCQEQPDRAGYQSGVSQAVQQLRQGRLSKAVLSRLLLLDFDQPPCAETVFQGLRQQNPEAYHFCMSLPGSGVLIGASPELLLHKQGLRFVTNPLAGSARRELDERADAGAAQALLQSHKDLHEHRLVIEEIERQLRPLCSELQLPEGPELLSTARLWHLSTRIEGELAQPLSALELACRLHPTPALCGFPTAEAQRLIAELEPFDRGVFGGIVGWCDEQGDGEWAVVIRCGVLEHTRLRLFAGAGLVSASCPEAEWQETGNKLGTMLAAFGLTREAS